ncbi:unnamed protein product, partial [Mesorhabditis belari]|uniref:Uncharacterized protein n=1 Tax=Mesorhabditis belari TaxID=2138241 RepID=A0AAF3FA00_9BILA
MASPRASLLPKHFLVIVSSFILISFLPISIDCESNEPDPLNIGVQKQLAEWRVRFRRDDEDELLNREQTTDPKKLFTFSRGNLKFDGKEKEDIFFKRR